MLFSPYFWLFFGCLFKNIKKFSKKPQAKILTYNTLNLQKMKSTILCVLTTFFFFNTFAQTPFPANGEVFRDDVIAQVNTTKFSFSEADYLEFLR